MSVQPSLGDAEILEKLNAITRELGGGEDVSEDAVKARLLETSPATLTSNMFSLGSFKRVNAEFYAGKVTIKTFITGYNNFEGTCNRECSVG